MNLTNRIQRTLLYKETVEAGFRVDGVEVERLRYLFAPLFDRAAQAVQRAGHDQDDCIIDRFLICRMGTGNSWQAPVESLGERGRLLMRLMASAEHVAGHGCEASDVQVVGLCVTATLEQWV